MNAEKYVGLDVHKATTVVAVLDAKGKLTCESILETKTETIRDFIRGLSGRVHVTLEEGAQAAWLHDLITPLVAELIVCNPRENPSGKGNKSDRIDAAKLAHWLRMGELKAVYHGEHGTRELKELARCYAMLVEDCTRAMNRIKAVYRSRGIACTGKGVYQPSQRAEWLAKLEERGARVRTESLLLQLEALQELRKKARKAMVEASRQHAATKGLRTIPSLGPVRVAQVIAILDTPWRFRTKRELWAYAGLAVVRRTSAEYRFEGGRVQKAKKAGATRGLNQNGNRRLKEVFKGAANTAVGKEPFKTYYQGLVEAGAKPAIARVSLARKIAAIVLTLWKTGEVFDAEKLSKQPA